MSSEQNDVPIHSQYKVISGFYSSVEMIGKLDAILTFNGNPFLWKVPGSKTSLIAIFIH